MNNYEQLETNEKMKSLSKKTDVNKNQMEILELKNTINEIKHSGDRPNGQAEVTEETIIELEDWAIEITQSEQQRKKYTKNVKLPIYFPILMSSI